MERVVQDRAMTEAAGSIPECLPTYIITKVVGRHDGGCFRAIGFRFSSIQQAMQAIDTDLEPPAAAGSRAASSTDKPKADAPSSLSPTTRQAPAVTAAVPPAVAPKQYGTPEAGRAETILVAAPAATEREPSAAYPALAPTPAVPDESVVCNLEGVVQPGERGYCVQNGGKIVSS